MSKWILIINAIRSRPSTRGLKKKNKHHQNRSHEYWTECFYNANKCHKQSGRVWTLTRNSEKEKTHFYHFIFVFTFPRIPFIFSIYFHFNPGILHLCWSKACHKQWQQTIKCHMFCFQIIKLETEKGGNNKHGGCCTVALARRGQTHLDRENDGTTKK